MRPVTDLVRQAAPFTVESDFGAFRSLAATFCLAMTLAVAVAERRTELFAA